MTAQTQHTSRVAGPDSTLAADKTTQEALHLIHSKLQDDRLALIKRLDEGTEIASRFPAGPVAKVSTARPVKKGDEPILSDAALTSIRAKYKTAAPKIAYPANPRTDRKQVIPGLAYGVDPQTGKVDGGYTKRQERNLLLLEADFRSNLYDIVKKDPAELKFFTDRTRKRPDLSLEDQKKLYKEAISLYGKASAFAKSTRDPRDDKWVKKLYNDILTDHDQLFKQGKQLSFLGEGALMQGYAYFWCLAHKETVGQHRVQLNNLLKEKTISIPGYAKKIGVYILRKLGDKILGD